MFYRKARKNTYSTFESLASNLPRFYLIHYRSASLRLFLITLVPMYRSQSACRIEFFFSTVRIKKHIYIYLVLIYIYIYARETFYNNRDVIVAKSPGHCDVNMREQEKREALRFGIGNRVYSSDPERLSDHTQSVYAKKIAAKRKFMNPSCRNSGTLSCSSRRRGKLVIVALYDRA